MKIKSIKNTGRIAQKTGQSLLIFGLVGAFTVAPFASTRVAADRFQEQINALNAQNGQINGQRQELGQEAESISALIANLQAEINAVQAKINENQTKLADLQKQIKAAEEELARQKDLLGQTIKAMYVEGDISTVEMLASSKDLSDFFDKQQYRESVRSKIKTTLDKITQLKLELNTQKQLVEKLIGEQKALQTKLAAQRAENNRVLSLNQSQQAELNSQMQANSSRIAELRRQQAAENARLFSSRGGSIRTVPDSSGYPWANYRAGSWTHAGSCYYGDDVDPWGMCYRQCVSYAAWKIYKTKGYMPYGWGNANNWDDRARASGIAVDGNPRAGSIAVSNSGTWGHVMYVESVNANGTINISQYNVSLTGTYSEATINPRGLSFIHF
jgi:surface antigen